MRRSRIINQLSMPIYEYRCKKCEKRTEVLVRAPAKPPTRCRECGGRLEKLISSPAIQFKGEGWYVTDYARKGSVAEKVEKELSSDTSPQKSAGDKEKPKQAAKKTDKA
jgi:putative FmdB family regulatory protein